VKTVRSVGSSGLCGRVRPGRHPRLAGRSSSAARRCGPTSWVHDGYIDGHDAAAATVSFVGTTRAWKRRNRTHRQAPPATFTGFEPPEHTMWTVEGQIEQIGRFARRLNASTGWRRWAGKSLFTFPLWLMLGGGVVVVAAALLRWAF
jgi:hypothetical protein